MIKEIFENSKERYGSRRITAALRRNSYKISQKRVHRLMVSNGFTPRRKKKFKPTTNNKHSYGIALNLVPQKFQSLLSNTFVSQSMSRLSCRWDNSVAESFLKTLKVELVYRQVFSTCLEARFTIIDYIENWYNKERLHSSLNYKTPQEVEIESVKSNR